MPYRGLSDKRLLNLKRKGITGVRLNYFVIKKLTPTDIAEIAKYEQCSVAEINEILRDNRSGNQLTRVETIWLIARLTGHDFHQVITNFWFNGIILVAC